MESNLEDVMRSLGGLRLAHETSEGHGQIPLRQSSDKTTAFQSLIQNLAESAIATQGHALALKSFLGNDPILSSVGITEIQSHRTEAEKLRNIARIFNYTAAKIDETLERPVIAQLKSLGCQSAPPHIQNLLTHFHEKLRSIVRDVLDKSSDQDVVLWKIAEECYNQAVGPGGKLDAKDYFLQLGEACLESPYDPDFESEEYYEHENRLEIDTAYAECWAYNLQLRRKNSEENERAKIQSWIDYWADVLHGCPGEPTLFRPGRAIKALAGEPPHTPRYLFRTFDDGSPGRSDDDMIASSASILKQPGGRRIDLLSLDKHTATQQLHLHLDKRPFDEHDEDNLMSWTSSLLFALQYAIWRCHKRQASPADVKICAVDTTRFPRGQFAQDMWLLRIYEEHAKKLGGDIAKFSGFRLNDKRYQNGEYVSQGLLYHSGRSCVVSLEALINSGLHSLYPEFSEAQGMEYVAKRVLELRLLWDMELAKTTHQEVRDAFSIARCFPGLATLDLALMLLSFKSRTRKRMTIFRYGDGK